MVMMICCNQLVITGWLVVLQKKDIDVRGIDAAEVDDLGLCDIHLCDLFVSSRPAWLHSQRYNFHCAMN